MIPEEGYTVLVNRSDSISIRRDIPTGAGVEARESFTAVRFTVLSADDRRLLSLSATNVVITIDANGEASEAPL